MRESSTEELNKILENMILEEYPDYVHTLDQSQKNLQEYILSYLISQNMDKKTVIKRSQLNRTYAYQILSGDRRHPSRNKILALCFGAHMPLKETQQVLTLSHNSILYAKDKRDAAIILCIHNKIYDLSEVNLFLDDYHFEVIG